ncbi:MAG: cytochrome C [Saprospiraceae bacterium]|nr:MAG: cytochrome C [Saprospiraceae bacterium]
MRKARLKKTAFVAATIFALIQFVQPARNQSGQVLDTDISKKVSVPEGVQSILSKSCYDCHSNSTDYPWYTYVQPAGWLMAYHVRNGKEKLNFSDFGSYTKRRQESKLKSIASQIEDDAMPLFSYTLMHANARLSPGEKDAIVNWANHARDSLSSKN